MPAVVSSTEGSSSAGTSDDDGRRLWSRCSKKERNFSRISSEDMLRMRLGVYERSSGERVAHALRAGVLLLARDQQADPDAVLGDRHRLVTARLQRLIDRSPALLGLGLDEDEPLAQRPRPAVARDQPHVSVAGHPLALVHRAERRAPV